MALAAISTVIGLAGTAVSAMGQMQQGQAQKQQAEYQAQMAQRNAEIANQNAELAEAEGRESQKIGAENAQKKRLEAAQIVGQQRAAAAASGAQVDQGAFLDLSLDTAEKGELDALALFEQGQQEDYMKRVEGWNMRQQAQGQNAQAGLYKMQGSQMSPLLNAGGTLLSGAAQAGSGYYMMTKKSK